MCFLLAVDFWVGGAGTGSILKRTRFGSQVSQATGPWLSLVQYMPAKHTSSWQLAKPHQAEHQKPLDSRAELKCLSHSTYHRTTQSPNHLIRTLRIEDLHSGHFPLPHHRRHGSHHGTCSEQSQSRGDRWRITGKLGGRTQKPISKREIPLNRRQNRQERL